MAEDNSCESNEHTSHVSHGSSSGLSYFSTSCTLKPDILPSISEWQTANLDVETSRPQTLEEEMARLQVLKSYLILDADREPSFERLTALASRIFDVPIALVSLVDFNRQWFLSNRGLGEVRETPRNLAFCAHAILSTNDLFVVPDATKDFRFKNNLLVTHDPKIRFYAGAPLICPEGYKLGTFCIIDQKIRPDGLNLTEKQNLLELAALVVDQLVLRKARVEEQEHEHSRIIACTAHDLLTPLTAINLNLSLLQEDENLKVDRHQQDLIHTSIKCTDVMSRICRQTMEKFRGSLMSNANTSMGNFDDEQMFEDGQDEEGAVVINRMVESIGQIIEAYPKKVPLTMEVYESVPPVIISDDMRLFRSALNLLTNACKATETGSINFRIFVKQTDDEIHGDGVQKSDSRLVFECEDSGPGIDVEKLPNLFSPYIDKKIHHRRGSSRNDSLELPNVGLGLYSVAQNIKLLGGEYGYKPRKKEFVQTSASGSESSVVNSVDEEGQAGSIFWFSIPITLPLSVHMKKETFDKNQVEDEEKQFQTNEVEEIKTDVADVADVVMTDANTAEVIKRGLKRNLSSRSTGSPDNMVVQINSTIPKTHEKINLGASERKGRSDKKALIAYAETVSCCTESIVNSNQSNNCDCSEGSGKPKKKALVIDDSLTIRKGIVRALSKLGLEAQQAKNGFEGLQRLKSNCYDFVLCDFLMPVMDGLDCVQQYRDWEALHRSWFRQYIIGISAHATSNDAETGLRVGMDGYYSKPLALKILKEIAVSERVQENRKVIDEKHQERLNQRSTTCKMQDSEIDDGSNASISSSSCNDKSAPLCLIAEDSTSIRQTMAKCISLNGWRSTIVNNGEDALQLLKKRSYDAVFLDDNMASCILKFREWEAENRVARQRCVYLISGSYSPKKHSILPHGFDGALGKPVKVKELSDLLETAGKSRNMAQIVAR